MIEFSIQAEISHAWQLVKKDWWFFGGVSFITLILYGIPQLLAEVWQQDYPLLATLFWIFSVVIYVIIEMGMITIGFKTLSGQPKKISDLIATTKPFWAYFFMTIAYSIMTYIGIILLIIPGIYVGIKGVFAGPLLLEKNLGPIAAIQQSFRITKGSFAKLFWFLIVLLLVNVLGALALGIGLLWSGPVTLLALLSVYRKLVSSYSPVPAKG